MPIYEFERPGGTITERLVTLDTEEIKCPKCHRKAKRIISLCTFRLKGGGWFDDGCSSRGQKSK